MIIHFLYVSKLSGGDKITRKEYNYLYEKNLTPLPNNFDTCPWVINATANVNREVDTNCISFDEFEDGNKYDESFYDYNNYYNDRIDGRYGNNPIDYGNINNPIDYRGRYGNMNRLAYNNYLHSKPF